MEITFLILGGLVMLTIGAELLVRGSVRVVEQLGVSPLLIGLTLVGFGTSTPELVTSLQAALIGSPGIALGNIVGSNIANILLILGVSGLIFPIAVEGKALGRDGLFVVATALLLLVVSLTVGLQRWAGAVFLVGLLSYLVYAYRQERTGGAIAGDHTAAFDKAEAMGAADPALRPGVIKRGEGMAAWLVPLATALVGLVTIIFGGRLLVDGAVDLARVIGLSETVIGLTIVAVGTSAPELVTSLIAAVRKQTDMALGNILGSCIYNILGIAGFTALIAPTPVPAEIVGFDIPVMVAASVLLLLFAWTGRRISRLEGATFLALYLAYIAYLIGT